MSNEKYQNGSNVCIVAKVPDHIADQFPKDSDPDADDPHITVLFVGDLPKEKVGALINTCQRVFSQCPLINAALDSKVSYFDPSDSSDGRRVAKLDVICPDLHPLHKQLWDELEAAGVEVAHSHPEYHPHTTLDYIEPDSEYEGSVPIGKWDIDAIEIWGFEDHICIPFINMNIIANNVVNRIIAKNVTARFFNVSEVRDSAFQYTLETLDHAESISSEYIETLDEIILQIDISSHQILDWHGDKLKRKVLRTKNDINSMVETIKAIKKEAESTQVISRIVNAQWSRLKNYFHVRNPLFHATTGPRAMKVIEEGFKSDSYSNYGAGNVVGVSFSRSLDYLLGGHFGNAIFIVDKDELSNKFKIDHIESYPEEREERVDTKHIPPRYIKGFIYNGKLMRNDFSYFSSLPFPVVHRPKKDWELIGDLT